MIKMEPKIDQTIEVQCYSGYKANERPISFILDGNKLMVDEIIDQWNTPEYRYFKIVADDGNRYLLKCNFAGEWMLDRVFPG